MYIEPNTIIKIYHNVPLDNTFEHTIYFANKIAQDNYFHGNQNILKYTLTRQSYQRVVKGKMRVEVQSENLYDCNYLAFQNTAFGNKWFYAFITGVEYVNNETSEITFEIDPMQTRLFDVTLKECFVEREHSATDNIGEHILAEPVQCGEYISSDYSIVNNTRDCAIIIAVCDADDSTRTGGELYDGIYGGCDLWAYDVSDHSAVTTKLNSYIQKPDSVVSVYMCPKMLINGGVITAGGMHLGYGQSGTGDNRSFAQLTGTEPFNTPNQTDYIPKNKKLYTYPYNYFHVSNASGQSLNLRYEFFKDLTPVLWIDGTFVQPAQLVARPSNYKGYPDYTELGGYVSSKDESITLEGYPVCSWNVDAYKQWLAQNSVPLALNFVTGVATASISSKFSTHPEASMGLSVLGQVTNLMSQHYQASIAADVCRGNTNNGNTNVANGLQAFWTTRKHVSAENAKMIDDFFSKFGYSCQKIKVPNRNVRPHWTYTKTVGCVVVGNAPADEIRAICDIYNKGITFWSSPNEVGNYSLDNSV